MKELTLNQKNKFLDYALKDMINDDDDNWNYICISYNRWHYIYIKKYSIRKYNNIIFNGKQILRFPELLNAIVKRLKSQSYTRYNVSEESFNLGAICVVNNCSYRRRLLNRVRKQISTSK